MATRSTPPLSEAVRAYLEVRALDLAPSSLAGERGLLDRLCSYLGPRQVGRVNADDLERFMAALKRGDERAGCRTPYGAAAMNLAMYRLRGFVKWAARKSYMRGDALDGIKATKPDARRDYLRLSPAELLSMLANAEHPRDRALLALGMNTALRCSEVVAIKLGGVDLDNGEFYALIGKSRTSDYMPISSDLDSELRRWLTWYAENNNGKSLAANHFLFPAKEPTRFYRTKGGELHWKAGPLKPEKSMGRRSALNVVRKALLGLGYTEEEIEREGFHTLRRSVARIYFDSIGATPHALRETSALLHHKSTETTERYLGLDVDRAQRDRRLKGKPFLSGMAQEGVTPIETGKRAVEL